MARRGSEAKDPNFPPRPSTSRPLSPAHRPDSLGFCLCLFCAVGPDLPLSTSDHRTPHHLLVLPAPQCRTHHPGHWPLPRRQAPEASECWAGQQLMLQLRAFRPKGTRVWAEASGPWVPRMHFILPILASGPRAVSYRVRSKAHATQAA